MNEAQIMDSPKHNTASFDPAKVVVRPWRNEDISAIIACHEAAYPDYPPEDQFDERLHAMQINAFPEGQILAEYEGRVIGYCTSLIVQLDDDSHAYTYTEITGAYTFSTHEPGGDTLYGADIAVHPDYRGCGVAGLLYKERHALVQRYNLRRMVAYGRIPGYKDYAGKMTPEEYVDQVVAGTLNDPALNAHLKAGYRVRRILLDYMPDETSLNYSTFLERPNPDFDPAKRAIAASPLKRPVRSMRVCAAQFHMRPIKSWDEFAQTVDFFVDTADTYHCHFLLLPELFTAQLFTTLPPDLEPAVALRQLAGMVDRYRELLAAQAKDHRLCIIGGTHPVERNGRIYNTAHIFTPHGKIFTQDKLHIGLQERKEFGITPGEEIRVFDTPFCRIAVLPSTDIEYPELARLLTLAGVEVIFVPFSTDERKAYLRVRYSAQARASENYLYVVASGNAGNLPSTKNYLINYAQSAVFTPSDFSFPPGGIAGEADPNAETVVIADLDLNVLALQREHGSVRPLFERRSDLYDLRLKQPIRVVKW